MKRDILILLAIASIILLVNLGAGSLDSWDEAFYAEVSREILQRNDWVNLYWSGEPWSDKPPLYMWVTTFFYKIFGINEFSARLFSAISGMGIVILTYLLGRRIFTREVGFLSAVMMASTYHFIAFAKAGTLDITFTFFLFLSIYFFLLGEDNQRNIVFSFISFSLAFLTKSFGALLIPLILGVYVIAFRKWRMVFNRYTAAGAVITLIMVGSWHAAAFIRYGSNFVNDYVLKHLVVRTMQSLDGHQGGLINYINVILYKAKPWGTVGLLALPFFTFLSFKNKETKNYILIFWIAVVYVIFTAIRTKLHWYIIPIYPPIMLVAGWAADKLLKNRARVLVIAISLVGVIYFGATKGIFTLDYNPEIKSFAAEVEEISSGAGNIYLYGISDPGTQFYFGGIAKNILEEEVYAVADTKGTIIISRTEILEKLDFNGEIIPSGRDGLSAVKIK